MASAVILACLACPGTMPVASAAEPADAPSATACSGLRGRTIPAERIALPTRGATVVDASLVPESEPGNENGEFCRVTGAIRPVSYTAPNINFQVNLPSAWNGKALHFGGGGFNGRLVTGLGHYIKQPDSEPTPLARGYVTYGSDAGHQSDIPFDGRFFLNDEALRNYGHEQIKKTRDVAMLLVRALYGTEPKYSYFVGGSQGGHEAFDAVQRYPDDYDGVIAGYPAHNLVLLHLSANRYARALHRAWLSPTETSRLRDAVYAACDGLDGAADGIISNVSACRVATAAFARTDDSNPLRCAGGIDTGDDCLSDGQIGTLVIMDTPYELDFSLYADDDGNSRFPKWTPFEGSTFTDGGFPNLGADGPHQALQFLPGDATPRYAIARDLTLDTMTGFDPRRYAGRITELAQLISANSIDIDRFRDKGGKLIFYHGAIDDYIPVYSSIEYYERLLRRYEQLALDTFVRFYVIPGMGHTTGVFNARIAALDALEGWVEHDRAPGALLATDANEPTRGRTRPVCRYPEWPKYRGQGSLGKAGSFDCVADQVVP